MSSRAEIDEASASLMRTMTARLGEVTRVLQAALLTDIPELRGNAQLVELLHDSVEGNVATVFTAIQHGIPGDDVTAPTAALEYARRLAQHDVSPNALVRAYRLGQQELLRQVLAEIRARGMDPELALDTFETVNISASQYIDWVSEQVVGVYQTERDRWRENRDRVLAQRVREILSDGPTASIDELTTSLRYPFGHRHLAVIGWYSTNDHAGELIDVERFVVEAADKLGATARPMFIAQDRVTGIAWIPLHDRSSQSAVDKLVDVAGNRPHGLSLAIGEPLAGIAGFRRSHQLADAARIVALDGTRSDTAIITSREPGVMIAAMLNGDLSHADSWIVEVLGELASPTESDAGLRETLRVYLECGASFKDTGARLHLHSNTVKYRIGRAVERRGRPLEEGRLDVEIALLLCARFPRLLKGPADRSGYRSES
ncbi:PucR family transcriptional regulator [Gordonia sp. TBRC 11910]|uniref:PucR family transcriptional regulator n=1 Tax=Gordonia asplenii TaxID=2725283 RepID=A0A848KWN8_9ACTN|nr:helix-turn-helix domain-containing protein [Gordonia asplenii]NMO02719.1 PucR family transcriptional regulator [Gordonia asplenii]